ncbi:hypothetical protein QQF64_000028 [Cirrhinus molitorella]|uniref:Uncharacterized protein n=1 Tax=Cirrhinus molitorella TaxID=172907 RepID=A0ABR3NWG4_9TELE
MSEQLTVFCPWFVMTKMPKPENASDRRTLFQHRPSPSNTGCGWNGTGDCPELSLGLICVLLLIFIILQHITITAEKDLIKSYKNTVKS